MEESTSPQTIPSNLANLGDRFLGLLIDGIVFMAIYYTLDLFLGWIISYFLASFYYLLRDALPFLEGQSVGKKVMKTRAVKEDSGAPLTNDYVTSIMRNIPLFIIVVDAIFIFIGDERKRLGDKIGKTIVIKEG